MSYTVTVTRTPIASGAVVLPERTEGQPLFADGPKGIRVFMVVSIEDKFRFDSLPFPEDGEKRRTVKVRNLVTAQDVKVRRGPCGLGCYCGAEVVSA